MLLIIILLLPQPSTTQLSNIFPNRTDDVSAVAAVADKIFLQFENYIKVLHFDHSSINIISKLSGSILINYDRIRVDIRMHREIEAYFHLLIVNEKKLRNTKIMPERLQSIDVVLFLILNDNYENNSDLCNEPFIFQADAVYIYDLPKNKSWACEYYCGEKFSRKRKIDVYDKNIPNFRSYSRRCYHFGGYNFRVGYTETVPLIQTTNNSGVIGHCGPEYDILRRLSKILNFTFKMIYFPPTIEGTKYDMITQLKNGSLDWGLGGISITYFRYDAVEFMTAIISTSYHATYAPTEYSPALYDDVYSKNIIIISSIILLAVLCIAILLRIAQKLAKKDDISFLRYAIIASQVLIEQAIHDLPKIITKWSYQLRYLFCFWLLLSSSLVTYLKTIQTTKYMKSDHFSPQSIEDLINIGYKFQATTDDYNFMTDYCYTSLAPCKHMIDQTTKNDDICDIIQKFPNSKTSLMREELSIKYFLGFNRCNISSDININLLKIDYGFSWHSWMFKKYTPFVQKFSNVVLQMWSSGLISHWYSSSVRDTKQKTNKISGSPKKIKLEHVEYPLKFIICFHTLSILVFLGEIYYYRRN